MKIVYYLCLASILFTSLTCKKKDNFSEVKNKKVQLQGKLNTSSNLKIGENLLVTINVPDTLEVKDITTSQVDLVIVNSLQNADACVLVYKIDTVSKKPNLINSNDLEVELFFNNVKSNASCGSFTKNSKPFQCVISILPKAKGIYYIETSNFNSNFKINNSINAINAISINAIDKRHNMLANYLAGYNETTVNDWLNSFSKKEAEGGGIYGFRVE